MKKIDFNHDWIFTQEGTRRRETVTLPHDAIINTDRNPGMRNYFLLAGFEGGKYIYTKTFHAPEEYRHKTLILEFEAVYCMSRVYINGEPVCEKPYGFTPFWVSLNPYLRFGGDNEIRVEANVPKEGHGRWYTGGGIYRPVHLCIGEENHIALSGVKVTTLGIHPARIQVDVEIQGAGLVSVDIRKDGKTVASGSREVKPEEGEAADSGREAEDSGRAAKSIKREAGAGNASVSLQLEVPDAKLWSAETPELYQAAVTLARGEKVYDEVTESFGIRTIEVNPEKGLLINGVPTFLRGGCIHNDNGVIGVINNDATELHRARILKKSGFNALRSAHHPMSRSLMKACDEVGLYVMDEAFDYWYRPKGGNPHCGLFLDTFREDTRAMVQDAYNHPCVVIYSIGNEIPEAGGVKGVRVGKEIVDIIRSIDATRPTTLCPSVHWLREYLDGVPYLTRDEDEWMAESPENKEKDWKHYRRIFLGAAANIPEDEKNLPYPPTFVRMDEEATKNLYPYLDIAGYNYYEDKYDTLHELHPERVLLGTETRGERIVDTMRYAREHPFLIGDFIWTLQEHLGEVNCCNISYGENSPGKDSHEIDSSGKDSPGKDSPGKDSHEIDSSGKDSSGKDSPGKDSHGKGTEEKEKGHFSGRAYPWLINYGGTIDLIGTILPSIHKYEFAWDEKKKGLYLAAQPPVHEGLAPEVNGYRWTDAVDGWTYEGYEGKPTWVDAYTDAAEVEIFINGTSAGRSPVKDYYAKVPCFYQPGELLGVGYDGNGKELYRTSVRTAGQETEICAVPDKTILQAGEEDFCFIDISVTDSRGRLKLLPERKVEIRIEGAGSIQGFGSANHLNEEKFNQPCHTTYLGRLQAVIRSGKKPGEIKVTFSGEGMEDAVVRLRAEA